MRFPPSSLEHPEVITFLTEHHLASFTTVGTDGRPHSVPVGFTWDPDSGLARVITRVTSAKARRILAHPASPIAICQVDGGRWVALEGTAVVTEDPHRIAEAVERYAVRYRQPEPNPDRIAIEISVEHVLGSRGLFG